MASYVAMYLEAKRHHSSIQTTIIAAHPDQSCFKETLKAVKTTLLVTCSVLVTVFFNALVYAHIFRTFTAERSLYFSVRNWNIVILMLNSLFNPFIYILRSTKFKKELKRKFCMCFNLKSY